MVPAARPNSRSRSELTARATSSRTSGGSAGQATRWIRYGDSTAAAPTARKARNRATLMRPPPLRERRARATWRAPGRSVRARRRAARGASARPRRRGGPASSRRRRTDRLDARDERLLVDRADVAPRDDTVGADEVRLGDAKDPVRERDAPVVIDHRGPAHAEIPDVRATVVRRILIEDADDDDVARAVALVHAYERGVLLLARDAPRGPEVEDDDLSRVLRERERRAALEAHERERGGLLADRARPDVVRVATEREGKRQHERQERERYGGARDAADHFAVATTPATARPAARRRGGGSAAKSAPRPTTAPPAQSH